LPDRKESVKHNIHLEQLEAKLKIEIICSFLPCAMLSVQLAECPTAPSAAKLDITKPLAGQHTCQLVANGQPMGAIQLLVRK